MAGSHTSFKHTLQDPVLYACSKHTNTWNNTAHPYWTKTGVLNLSNDLSIATQYTAIAPSLFIALTQVIIYSCSGLDLFPLRELLFSIILLERFLSPIKIHQVSKERKYTPSISYKLNKLSESEKRKIEKGWFRWFYRIVKKHCVLTGWKICLKIKAFSDNNKKISKITFLRWLTGWRNQKI